MPAKLVLRDQEYQVRAGMTIRHALEKCGISLQSVLAKGHSGTPRGQAGAVSSLADNVNLAGVEVILELLDRMEVLRGEMEQEIHRLARRVEELQGAPGRR